MHRGRFSEHKGTVLLCSVTERYDYVWSDGSLISQTYTNYENGIILSSDTARFIYDSWGTLQGFILNDSETYLYVKNLQGDIIAIVDELGKVIVEYSYDAWGNVTFHETSLQNMTKASTLCFVSPFTYRGYCYDYDIELYYLQSRYYSAEIGRFINTDDTQIAIVTQGYILGANLFAYCENNAVNYADPSGLIAYGFISTSSNNATLIHRANCLFNSRANYSLFKITYSKGIALDPKTGKVKTVYNPSYVYHSGTINTTKRLINIYYINGLFRVKGSVYYRTALEWKLYIESRHKSIFTKFKEAFMQKYGIQDYEYSLFIDAIDAMLEGTKFSEIFKIINIIDTALDFMAGYRDKLDKTILNCIKNARSNEYVMIVFSAAYQQYRYVSFPLYKGWVTNSTKKIY